MTKNTTVRDFTQGSTMGHVAIMASASSVGLMTLFVVDLVDMFFLSLLGETELAAAVGFSGTILFFTTSIAIGIAISMGALVARSLGRGDRQAARGFSINVLVFGAGVAFVVSGVLWFWVPTLLAYLGAEGRALDLSIQYLRIIVPSMFMVTLAMASSGILRACGDPRRAMMATVWGGLVNAALDPLLIFSLEMGIQGAAWASVMGRTVVMVYALNGSIRIHNLVGRFRLREFVDDLSEISRIAIPAMLTNVATPIGNAYVIGAIAKFGDGAVAGMSIIGRLTPVAFGIVFALSGAVGPIIGQNFGAGKFDRVRGSIRDANLFSLATVVAVSVLLFFLQDLIIAAFQATEEAAELIRLFCTWIAVSFIFNGTLFISNAAFNNLGYPHYSTVGNFAKATLGTIPFVYFGSLWGGAQGILIGQAVGTVIVGAASMWLCFRMIEKCRGSTGPRPGPGKKPFNLRIPLWPQTNTRG